MGRCGIKPTSAGSVIPLSALAILTASRDLAVLAASAALQVAAYPNQVRAVGTLPVFLRTASTNSATCGTPACFQYHSNTQYPTRASGGRPSSTSSSCWAPPRCSLLSRPNCTACFRALTMSSPASVNMITSGLAACALIRYEEKSVVPSGDRSPPTLV